MVEDDSSPLKDKTTLYTPTDNGTNNDFKIKQISDNTLPDVSDPEKIVLNKKDNSILEKRSNNTHKSMKRNSEASKETYNFGDLKITDETNSKNMSVSNYTVEDNNKRKSYISNQSRTNSFISIYY
jgi:hypothetical protein